MGQPEWIWDLLVDAWGRTEAEEFLEASQSDAARTIRLRTGEPLDGLTPVAGIAGAYVLPPVETVVDTMAVQDGASVAVGLALDPQPGDRILDMAAAPGGKALHVADRLDGRGVVVASDRHRRRVQSAVRRLEGSPVRWCVADALMTPYRSNSFDRVLVDAPCSGLGTMRRRPEVRFRVAASDLADLAAVQAHMVAEALPGGETRRTDRLFGMHGDPAGDHWHHRRHADRGGCRLARTAVGWRLVVGAAPDRD